MQILLITSFLTVIMFVVVFVKYINKEKVMPIVINLLFVMLNVFMWVIMKDANFLIVEEDGVEKYLLNIIHIFMVAITLAQMLVNIMIGFLNKIEKKEKQKKEKEAK